MAIRKIALLSFCLVLGIASVAHAGGWEIKPQSDTANARLIYKGDSQTSYLFECLSTEVVLTEFGVTDLLDLQANKKISDTPGSAMTAGAALMALATSVDGAPDLRPAETAPNAVRGWDMTIRFNKEDKALRALGKARMVSVFTTGYTMAVGLDDADKKNVRSFLSQCGVKI